MKTFLYHLVQLTTLSSFLAPMRAAVISTTPNLSNPLNISSVLDSLPNGTRLGAIDPTKFEIRPRYHDTKLPPTSILMTAVDTMVQLALDDWESPIRQHIFVIDDPRYSQVEIFISAPDPQRGTMPRAFAILGLFEIMNSILYDPTQRMRGSITSFFYNRQDVGFLEVRARRARRPDQQSVSSPATTTTTDNNATTTTTTLSAPAWQDRRLELAITQGLNTFTIYEAFYAVYALIRQTAIYAAANPRNAPVRDFSFKINAPPITAAGHPIAFSVRSLGNPPRTARTPPWFEYKWLVKALGQLPQHMLDRRNFNDVIDMKVKVDGVWVGEGYLVRRGYGSAAATS